MLAMVNKDESCFCGWLVTEIEVQIFYSGPECKSGSVVHKWSKARSLELNGAFGTGVKL